MGWPLSEVGTGWEQKMTCSSPHHLIIRACLPGPETGHYTHTHTHTRGISLLETLWKVVEVLINTHLQASLHMHDVLHRFRDGRVTGTATMELNLAHELVRIGQSPLLLVFLDLRK